VSDLEELTATINQFAIDRDWTQFHSAKNLAASISIEASELMECFQWDDPTADELKSDVRRLEQVKSEVADVLNYTLRMCSILELDPIEIVAKKLEENAKKYPIRLSKGKSTKYTELEGDE
jgi:dCTP diphosphatase